jgi:hypothetical protein
VVRDATVAQTLEQVVDRAAVALRPATYTGIEMLVRYSIRSAAADPSWPEFSRAPLEHGTRSTVSVPLIAGGAVLAHVDQPAVPRASRRRTRTGGPGPLSPP